MDSFSRTHTLIALITTGVFFGSCTQQDQIPSHSGREIDLGKINEMKNGTTPRQLKISPAEFWSQFSSDLGINIKDNRPIDDQVEELRASQSYRRISRSIEEEVGRNAHRFSCGSIEGISEFVKTLKAYDYAGKKSYDTIPGKGYILKFHSMKSPGRISDRSLYALLTLPDLAAEQTAPIILWAHEAGNSQGYSHIANRLNRLQAHAVTAMAIYPDECLKDRKRNSVVCSDTVDDPAKKTLYRFEPESILVLADCMRILNSEKRIGHLDSNFRKEHGFVPNVFYRKIQANANDGIKQVLMGYSYGAGIALIAAAQAGQLIKQHRRGKIQDPHFHPQYFQGLGVIAPFGSMLLGPSAAHIKGMFLNPKYSMPQSGYWSFGFLRDTIYRLMREQTWTALEEIKMEFALREAAFYSSFLSYSLKNRSGSAYSESCKLGYFYDNTDEMVNNPTTLSILSHFLEQQCTKTNFSTFILTGAGHAVFNRGTVGSHLEGHAAQIHSPVKGQDIYHALHYWYNTIQW